MYIFSSVFPLFFTVLPVVSTQTLPRPIITGQNYTGTGCPEGTVSTPTIYPNDTVFRHNIDQFAPYIGPGTKPSDRDLRCTVYMNITFEDPGWKLRVNAETGYVLGYLDIYDGVQVVFSRSFAWVGEGVESFNQEKIDGPQRGRFVRTIPANQTVNGAVSKCGGGTLRVVYRNRAVLTSSSQPVGGFPDDPQGEEVWTSQSTLGVEKCEL